MLCCFQAVDAAGKDSTIKHVMSGVNPQGVQVTSFKAPGPEELGHDFLWRIARDAGRQHRVPLRRQRLGAVRLGDTDIANQRHDDGQWPPRVRHLRRLRRVRRELIAERVPGGGLLARAVGAWVGGRANGSCHADDGDVGDGGPQGVAAEVAKRLNSRPPPLHLPQRRRDAKADGQACSTARIDPTRILRGPRIGPS